MITVEANKTKSPMAQVEAVLPLNSSAKLVNIEYEELKALRDNSKLVAGTLYRITDYVTTTASTSTTSAGKAFDIIVEALDKDILNENVKAIWHDGDEYFSKSKLTEWEVKYCLDNDTSRFWWADENNGKGVVYYMKDEYENECPYDFKNILFDGFYTFTFVTLTTGVISDGSLNVHAACNNNVIGAYKSNGRAFLNQIVFKTEGSYPCLHNTFGDNCMHNRFGKNCCYNLFGDNCVHNTFSDSCINNKLGNNCYGNTFKDNCRYNTFGDNCKLNTLNSFCQNNKFGNYCIGNKLQESCVGNSFGNNCSDKVITTSNTTIIFNEEYYNDGSGKLVPNKHPDLSTQASILPYKFMGHYVYEQLIPTNSMRAELDDKLILSAEAAGKGKAKAVGVTCAGGVLNASEDVSGYKWIRVIYTSMPDENGGYYYDYQGQNDLLPTSGILVKFDGDSFSGLTRIYDENGTDFKYLGNGYWHFNVIPANYPNPEIFIYCDGVKLADVVDSINIFDIEGNTIKTNYPPMLNGTHIDILLSDSAITSQQFILVLVK